MRQNTKDLVSLIETLKCVTDRLDLHYEFEQHTDFREDVKDKAALDSAKSMLFNADAIGVIGLLTMTTVPKIRVVLGDVAERLRLHIELHPYDDESENVADLDALNVMVTT